MFDRSAGGGESLRCHLPRRQRGYLVDSASSHKLVSKTKPCNSEHKRFCTVKLQIFSITFFSWKTALLKTCHALSNSYLLIIAREEYGTSSNITSAFSP